MTTGSIDEPKVAFAGRNREILDSSLRCLDLIQIIVAYMRRKDLFSDETARITLLEARANLEKEMERLAALRILTESNPETSLPS